MVLMKNCNQLLQQGAEQVYDTVSGSNSTATQSKSTAHLAGVEAQKATIEPSKTITKTNSLFNCEHYRKSWGSYK
jgi:hypothetical protein